ncbi:hypothetical protein GQ600_5676 [Phytophthora cactorum]|nr:hypothetical protein GQ600_5676 [Phytophthora cactorum]
MASAFDTGVGSAVQLKASSRANTLVAAGNTVRLTQALFSKANFVSSFSTGGSVECKAHGCSTSQISRLCWPGGGTNVKRGCDKIAISNVVLAHGEATLYRPGCRKQRTSGPQLLQQPLQQYQQTALEQQNTSHHSSKPFELLGVFIRLHVLRLPRGWLVHLAL